MTEKTNALTIAAGVACLLMASCVTVPPTYCAKQPRRTIKPRSHQMRLAVCNLVDQTGSGGNLIKTIPDILSMELLVPKRFEITERAELREIGARKTEEQRNKYKYAVDAFIQGNITRFSEEDRVMTLDVRVVNAYNGVVMYVGKHDVHYKKEQNVTTDIKDIQAIANAIHKAFPVLVASDMKVVSLSAEDISINLGARDGVKVGKGILVVADRDVIDNPSNFERYIGEGYIVEVMPDISKAIVAMPENRISALEADLRREVDSEKRELLLHDIAKEKSRVLDARSGFEVKDLVRFK
jgi:hypothetical protein